MENQSPKLLRDFTIQCDQTIEAVRPEFIFVGEKKKEITTLDVAIFVDGRARNKELEKIGKY